MAIDKKDVHWFGLYENMETCFNKCNKQANWSWKYNILPAHIQAQVQAQKYRRKKFRLKKKNIWIFIKLWQTYICVIGMGNYNSPALQPRWLKNVLDGGTDTDTGPTLQNSLGPGPKGDWSQTFLGLSRSGLDGMDLVLIATLGKSVVMQRGEMQMRC